MIRKLLTFTIPLIYLGILLWQQDPTFTESLGLHLTTGRLILTCHCVPTTNIYSFPQEHVPWIANSPLTAVLFYAVTQFLGVDILLVLKVTLIVASFLLMHAIAVRKGGNFWALTFSIIALTLLSTRFRVRPELFSFLFIALFFAVIDWFERHKRFRVLLILPVLELIWVNSHIYFIFGIVIYGAFLVQRMVLDRTHVDKRLFAIFGLLLIATLGNGYFLQGALFPLTILHQLTWQQREIASPFVWINDYGDQLPFNIGIPIMLYELTAILLICSYLLTMRKDKIFYLLVSIVGIGLASTVIRTFAVLGLVCLIPLAQNFSDLERYRYIDRHIAVVAKAIMALLLVLLVTVYTSGLTQKLPGLGYITYAARAVDFFQAAHMHGPVFNDIDAGEYLIYRLYPKEQVFIDSRPEAYTPKFAENYFQMLDNIHYFDAEANKYHFNTIILGKMNVPTTFLTALYYDVSWIPVYNDDFMIIYVKNAKDNEYVIQRYRLR